MITKQKARALQRRWKIVNRFTLEEARRTSVEDRYRQFLALTEWARSLGWEKELSREDALVRRRWNELRKAYRAKETKGVAAS